MWSDYEPDHNTNPTYIGRAQEGQKERKNKDMSRSHTHTHTRANVTLKTCEATSSIPWETESEVIDTKP